MTQRAITVLLTAVTGPYVANMGRAATATASVGTAATGAQAKTSALGGAFSGLTGKLLAGGGLVYGLTQGAQLLMSYETALVGVGKTTGLAGQELQGLGRELTELAKGIQGSAEDMMGIAQSAAQLGVENENIVEFTEVIANMASATDLTVDSAATDMARLSNVLGRPIEEVEALGSSVVALGNNMATTEPEILNLATRLAAAGRTAGLSDADVVGLAAAMSELGIEAEAGGTAMSRVLNEVTKAVGTGDEAVATFAATAQMSAQEFTEAWTSDPQMALQAFLEGLGQLSDGDRFTVMEELGLDAARLTDVLLRTSSGADGLASAFNLSNTAMEENVALAEEAAVANATAAAAWDNLKDTLADFGREAAGAEDGTNALTDLLNGLAVGVENLDEFLNQSTESTGDATTMLGKFGDAMEGLVEPFAAVLMGNQEMFDESWMGGAREYRQELRAAAEATGALSADHAMLNTAAGRTAQVASEASESVVALGESEQDAAASAASMLEQHIMLADELQAQRDPVFALTNALDDVRAAEQNYQATIEEHGPKSAEAEDASWALFEALESMTDASLRVGPEGFDQAIDRVDALASSNRISAQVADDLKTALREARGAAGEFTGDYTMSLRVDMPRADQVLLNSAQRLAGTSGATTTISVPTGARAHGGPVDAGMPYLVGEQGPELFWPDTAGRVMSAGETARMGGTSSMTNNATYNVYAPSDKADDLLRAADDREWMRGRLVS